MSVATKHPPTDTTDDVHETLQHVISTVSVPFESAGFVLEIDTSAGHSTQGPGETKTAAQMLVEADTALYDAKEVRWSILLRFDESMQMRSARDFRRLTELDAAVARGEFEMYFQPDFDLRTDTLVGAEALLRWNHPRLGVINAAEFIEDLDRFELIDRLLPMIIDEATSFAQYYADTDSGDGHHRSTQRFVRLPDADNPPGWLPATPQWPDGLAN
jgi:predicted signal transduction protein with EAL and GGDEF domain